MAVGEVLGLVLGVPFFAAMGFTGGAVVWQGLCPSREDREPVTLRKQLGAVLLGLVTIAFAVAAGSFFVVSLFDGSFSAPER